MNEAPAEDLKDATDMIARLLASPLRVQDFIPLSREEICVRESHWTPDKPNA